MKAQKAQVVIVSKRRIVSDKVIFEVVYFKMTIKNRNIIRKFSFLAAKKSQLASSSTILSAMSSFEMLEASTQLWLLPKWNQKELQGSHQMYWTLGLFKVWVLLYHLANLKELLNVSLWEIKILIDPNKKEFQLGAKQKLRKL